MTSTPHSLLVVDDDERFLTRVLRAFSERGFDVQGASGYDTALQIAQVNPPEFALVDLRLPKKSGLEVVRALRELDPATVVVVLTGYGSIATAVESVKLGAKTYLTKPADVDQILAAFLESGDGEADAAIDTPSLSRVEWEHIQRVLADCNGNISKAARALGLHRRSLQRKLAKHPTPR